MSTSGRMRGEPQARYRDGDADWLRWITAQLSIDTTTKERLERIAQRLEESADTGARDGC